MNNLPTHAEGADELDRLCSDFFKAQLQRPWPNAPVAAPAAEPRRAPARRDGTTRARLTLAASVALALGACWVLSNGFEPAAPTGGSHPAAGAPGLLPGSGADAADHPTLKKLQEQNAKPPQIDLGEEP